MLHDNNVFALDLKQESSKPNKRTHRAKADIAPREQMTPAVVDGQSSSGRVASSNL